MCHVIDTEKTALIAEKNHQKKNTISVFSVLKSQYTSNLHKVNMIPSETADVC